MRRWLTDPWRKPRLLEALVWGYLAWSVLPVAIAVWDGALKNYVPNLGYDWGGRLLAAWLDR